MLDPDIAEFVERVRADYPGCFACGSDNPVGLHIGATDLDGDVAVARYDPTEHHAGAGNTLHGGLAATVLDEIMVWAAILTERVLTVTGTLDLRYRRPVSVHGELLIRGEVVERSGRRLRCRGWIESGGSEAVTATGVYLVARTFEPSSDTL